MIFFTNFGVGDGFAGCARGPFIFIRPQYRYDEGLIAHEKVHRWQWLRTFGLHSFLYLLSDEYKLRAEVEAYREQLKYSPGRELLFAGFIAGKYGLSISYADAAEALR